LQFLECRSRREASIVEQLSQLFRVLKARQTIGTIVLHSTVEIRRAPRGDRAALIAQNTQVDAHTVKRNRCQYTLDAADLVA
jgi:hypothetical protein